MSFQLNMPPSAIAQLAEKEEGLKEEGVDAGKKREDWKKLKELEEARKAGTAPAMQDEEGKDINPHIPQYIMQAPWYFGSTAPTLKHQRPQDEKQKKFDDMNKWFKRGLKEGPVATKFRKGACENCGAMTHKKKDCMERPRKIGAKFTGSDIAPDEYVQEEVDFDFEGKRDRWNGFDQEHHKKIVEEYAKIEEAKQVLKAQRLENGEGEASEPVKEDSGGEEDEDKYADDLDMPGHKFESKQRITVRNLRIREDTAKYLVNLDPNSAYYDPKTRSMRQNPYAGTGKVDEEEMYAGDNFVRMSGDARNYAERQLFAWQAYEKGTDAHLQADPTKLELLARDYKTKKADYKQSVKQNILDKYGGEEHLEAPPKELLLAQSENYVEYSRHGTVIKGQERAPVKSVYEEDVYINNHASVWGSYWRDGSWGFKCCYSIVKESYCTGDSGREAALESIAHMKIAVESQKAAAQEAAATAAADGQLAGQSSDIKFNTFDVGCTTEAHKEAAKRTLEAYAKMKEDAAKEKEGKDDETKEKEKRRKRKEKKKQKKKERKKKRRKKHKKRDSSSSESSSESESEEDEAAAKERRVKEAMEKEEKRVRQVERLMGMDERKRPYNSIYSDAAPTEDEIEAWRRKQKHFEDPMSHFM